MIHIRFRAIFGTLLLILPFLPTQGSGQQADSLVIGVLVDEIGPDSADVLNLMIGEITAVVGTDAVVLFPLENVMENGYDVERARQMYQNLVDGNSDVILAFGPASAQALTGLPSYAKPTMLFGGVNRDLVDIPDRESSGISNFTYVITSLSYARDLETFSSLYAYQHLGVVVPEAQASLVPIREALDRQFANSDATYELIAYRSPESIDPFLGRIDALYLADSWGISPEEVEALATKLIENRIPSFSGVRRQDVELGFLATTHPDENLERFFRRIALHVQAVVDGEDLADRPIFVEFNEGLTLNFNTAELVGVPIRYSLIGTTEFVGDFVNSLSEQTYSLADVVNEALDENLSLRIARQDVELAQQDVRSAWTSYIPNLSARASGTALDPNLASISGGRNPQYSALGSLVLNQVLYSPGATAGINIRGNLLKAQQENLRASEQDLTLDAANAYFDALILKANLQIQNENLQVTRRNLAVAEANLAAGQTGRGNVLRLRSEASRDMQAVIEALNQLDQAFYGINQLLNNPIDREIDVDDVLIREGVFDNEGYRRLQELLDDPALRAPFESYLVNVALQNSPELAAINYNIAATDRTIALNGAQRFIPTIAAVAQYDRTFDQGGEGVPDPSLPAFDGYYTAGLSVSVPIFDSNTNNVDRQIARIQRQQLELSRESILVSIERNVRDVMLGLVNQIANIELSAVSAEAAAESLELTQTSFSNGAVGVIDLLDAQTNLLQAQLAQTRAAYGFMSTSMAMGRLVGHFFILMSDAENAEFLEGFDAFLNNQSR